MFGIRAMLKKKRTLDFNHQFELVDVLLYNNQNGTQHNVLLRLQRSGDCIKINVFLLLLRDSGVSNTKLKVKH